MGFLCNSLHALQMAPKSNLWAALSKQGSKTFPHLKPQANSHSAKMHIEKYRGPR